jgi:hypothetical protein
MQRTLAVCVPVFWLDARERGARDSNTGRAHSDCTCIQVWFADADGQGQGSWWKAQILIDNRPEQVGSIAWQRAPAASQTGEMLHHLIS